MKRAAGIFGLGAALAAGALVLTMSSPLIAPDIETVRIARLPGDTELDLAAACPAGSMRSADGDAWICLTDSVDAIDGEITVLPEGQRRDMLVCDAELPDDSGQWTTEVRYLPRGTRPPSCVLVCADLLWPGVSMAANVETGIEACLRAVCAPCQVRAGAWLACPHCLSDRTPSCAEACPAPVEEIP